MIFGATYLAALNPDFLLLIVNECLLYAPNQVCSSVKYSFPVWTVLYDTRISMIIIIEPQNATNTNILIHYLSKLMNLT